MSPRHKVSRQQELKQIYSLKEAGGLIERSRPDGLCSETLGQTQTKQNKKKQWFDTGDVLEGWGWGWGLGGGGVSLFGRPGKLERKLSSPQASP